MSDESLAFITRLARPADVANDAIRIAVKDAIDVGGVATTAGSRVVAERADRDGPAPADAACLAPARAAGAWLVGKANLHELCFGGTGVNQWFGTPRNPLDPSRIPGGSSSGCAVAVAVGEADIGFGSDTAGSIRNPSACCGTAGLKPTYGAVSLEGVWPLAPSLDTVGPMARTMAGLRTGWQLLAGSAAETVDVANVRVGRLEGLDGVEPIIDAAVDRALAAAEIEVVPVRLPGWVAAGQAAVTILLAEALVANRALWRSDGHRLGDDVQARFQRALAISKGALDQAHARRDPWRAELAECFAQVDVIALATMPWFPPAVGQHDIGVNPNAVPVNLAGHPALTLPVATDHEAGSADAALPASIQLVGPDDSEPLLLALGERLEAAAGYRR